ncbi:MAG: hypothetical protein WB714_01710 [Candidatus Sulfotelmatobacter sp.]
MSKKKGERGRGHVYLQHGAWFLQFYQPETRDGKLVDQLTDGAFADLQHRSQLRNRQQFHSCALVVTLLKF